MELETARRSRRCVIVEREVTIRIGITTARSNVSRVQHICVDELHFRSDTLVPVGMALLDVLAPKVGAFEQLRAFWNLATELVDVLLQDEL